MCEYGQDEINRLQALEMWLWRGLKKIKCSKRISNDELLTIVNEERCLTETTTKRKKTWIGHVLRGDGLLRDVLEKRMFEKKRTRQPRKGMISVIKKAISDPKEGAGDLQKRKNEKENK